MMKMEADLVTRLPSVSDTYNDAALGDMSSSSVG